MTIYRQGKDPEQITIPLNGYIGYEYEAMAVMDCIKNGKTESEIMPLDESLEIAKTLEQLRKSWNFKFPFEK